MIRLEDRMAPADTIVPCPSWCDKDHTVDTLDNSGIHRFAIVAEGVDLIQSFGTDEDGELVNDPAVIALRLDDAELSPDDALALAETLIYAAKIFKEVTA